MKFDFTGAEQFLACLGGEVSIGQVLDHPAYQVVTRHAGLFASGITAQDVENALNGKPSPFYGLADLSENLPRIHRLLQTIREHEAAWVATVEATLAGLFPGMVPQITIYPLIGYDVGIGLNDAVCLNCNTLAYLDEPMEFLFFIIHECVHVIYEHCHRVPALSEVASPADWRSYFNLWVQNEGFAVYAPLALREQMGYLADRDYRVLFDAGQLNAHRVTFLHVLEAFQSEAPQALDELLETCFGDRRLTYRMGCELIRRIERQHGLDAVRAAFLLDGDSFIADHQHLLET